MTIHNIHIYREMRLVFAGIEADTPQQAAKIAYERTTSEADRVEDCEGDSLAAVVDTLNAAGEIESETPVDFTIQRKLDAFHRLLPAAELVLARWETGDLAEAVRMLDDSVAEANASLNRGSRSHPESRCTLNRVG